MRVSGASARLAWSTRLLRYVFLTKRRPESVKNETNGMRADQSFFLVPFREGQISFNVHYCLSNSLSTSSTVDWN